jgi:hypothetical protein
VEFLGPGDDEDADEKIDNEVKATYSQLAAKGENVTLDKPGQRLKVRRRNIGVRCGGAQRGRRRSQATPETAVRAAGRRRVRHGGP